MARKIYTEEEKASALAKVEEIGLTKASKELGIAVGTLTAWKKKTKTDDTASPVEETVTPESKETKQKPVKKKTTKTQKTAKTANTDKDGKPTKIDKLIADNATLKEENEALKEEVKRLKKAIIEFLK